MPSRRREFDAVLLRADNFIQKQIYKLEQKKARQDAGIGRGYGQIPPSHEKTFRSPEPQSYGRPPSQGHLAPKGWIQEFDSQNQRWYYIEKSTGRAQWDPPSFPPDPQTQRWSRSQRADGIDDERLARKLQEEEDSCARRRNREISQPPAPTTAQNLGVDRADARKSAVSVSPHPSPHGRLPPGAHLDMRTGQVVTNMYPPGYPSNR